ncbi:MAG: ATP-binding protein, partial [Candidatus Omnitrophica bacterium]|nr:ATP-binding protein [Candidatus Omnitrophota bacterium]
IKNLALGMNIVSSGDLNHKILIKSKDEIGQLAGLFNKMTQDLRRLLEREKEFAVLDVEKKKAAELLKLNNDLKQEIIVRKKIEERLEKYSRELERRNIELNDVTHIISHEFKEPLRSINAYSGFIIKEYQDKLDENGVKYLERLKINTGRLQEIFENFLAYQSIEMREDVLKEIESEELIKELIAIHDYKIKQKNVQIIIRDGLPKVLYNREWLATVFIALISNAIKFNEKKNPIIEIGCKLKGDFYEFYLKDNGPGIDKQYFDNIFMIFKTLSKKEEYSGTGIGLTIVKKIVELNNGKVWLESELGQGSIFYFTIPIKQNKVNG